MGRNYFCRPWSETTSEPLTNDWGTSVYYFETDNLMNVLRQLEVFANGRVLKYDTEYTDDQFGGLSEVVLDAQEFAPYKISPKVFEDHWQSVHYRRFPEIVCTSDTLGGQPRLDGRRLAVGDIVSLVDVYADLSVSLRDFELSLQQVRQALHYCKDLHCQRDNPAKYCHNCSLRVKQEKTCLDEEDPEQDNWVRAARLFQTHFSR
jgi:uncharacterized protein (DUF433 family)